MKRIFLLLIVLSFGRCLYAQGGDILYTDYEPDITQTFHNYVQTDSLKFDLDRDGVYEWLFIGAPYIHNSIRIIIKPNVANSFPGVDTLGYYRRLRLQSCQFGDTLLNLNWEYGAQDFWATYWGYENPGVYPHDMFGVRYLTDNGFCYAWFEISVECDSSSWDQLPTVINLAIHRSAYCTQPDYPLRAGQTDYTWDIPENENSALASVYPNPTSNMLTVMGSNLHQIEIYNALGQRIITRPAESDRTTINLNIQPTGVYFVSVTDKEGKRCVKKVVKAR